MNRNCYRLVFNRERGTWMVAAEWTRARGKSSLARRRRVAALALGLAAAGMGVAEAGPAVPPSNAVAVASSGSRPFVFRGSVEGGQPVTVANARGGQDMSVASASRALGLNWQSFNIGDKSSVTFNLPDAASRVLNRIWDGNPSVIMGQLNSNGQVYLVNQNGILFGNGSQVNVGGLVASALNLSDNMASRLLDNGLPAVKGDRLEFAWDGSAAGFDAGFVTVEAGAVIRTPSGGRVLLLAPKTVQNLGLIEGGAGAEAILAAGGQVILTAPDDPSLRGMLVETRAWKGNDASGVPVSREGSASNGGAIRLGDKGVASLAALAVNQQGVVSASQAVNLDGSIMLVSGRTETAGLNLGLRGATADINLANGTTEGKDTAPIQAKQITVTQTTDQAEINWSGGFGVRADQVVRFVQPSNGAITYNYVYDEVHANSGATRSAIDGTLKANGQLYLINEKGIDFRSKAGANGGWEWQANVSAANFVASALAMNPDIVANGLLSQDGYSARAFYLRKAQWLAAESPANDEATRDAERAANLAAARAAAQAVFDPATIKIDAGARIGTSVDNGYAMLIGTSISQGGTITTPKGQTLLAAGADVYLKPPFAAALRGFTAEVNPLYVVQNWKDLSSNRENVWNAVAHGAIINSGSIYAPLGNITLTALDLTQAGRLVTSTSVTANGSIRLVARDQVALSGVSSVTTGEMPLTATARDLDQDGVAPYAGEATSATQSSFITGQVGGKLRLASGSITQVALDNAGGKTITSDQQFIASSVELIGAKINVEGSGDGQAGAQVLAKGGRIRSLSSDRFDATNGFVGDPISVPKSATAADGVGVFIGDGARLDVAGDTAAKSVADLFQKVELRGDEFAGNPVQRNSVLRGQTAMVDIRDEVAIADLSGWFGKVGQTVEEKAAAGGTISLRSTGSVVVKPAAELDVSGGRVDYAAAAVAESRVITRGGQVYRLNDAPATANYFALKTYTRQEAAYSEGRSAGSIEIVGNSLAVDGRLAGRTVRGTRQRNIGDPTSDRYALPLGGRLVVQDAGQHFADAAAAQIRFVRNAANASAGIDANGTGPARLELSQTLVDAGFSRFDLQSDGRIDVPAGVALELAPGGQFRATGRNLHVGGEISAPSGTIALATGGKDTQGKSYTYGNADNTLVIDNGAQLTAAGTWVNDTLDGLASNTAKAINGGSISLASIYDLDIRAGSSLDVSGGALLANRGTLTKGNAGSITLATGGIGKPGAESEKAAVTDVERRTASLFLDGGLAAYALGKGGSLEVDSSRIQLGTRFDSATVKGLSSADRLATGKLGAAFTGDFFDRGGFYNFTLVGRDGVDVMAGARIAPTPVNWSLAGVSGYSYRPTGSAIGGFARSLVLNPDLRGAPTKLSLATRSLNYGELTVGKGAYLGVTPGGGISLESWAQLSVMGTLEAPGGSIRLSRPANRSGDSYNLELIAYLERKQSESIFLGAESRLLAAGTAVLDPTTRAALEGGVSADTLRRLFRYKGNVLDGGTVDINAGLGYIVTASDPATGSRSLIDVSGAQDRLNVATVAGNGGVAYPVQTVGSAGGAVSLAAREGMLLDGAYAAGGKNGAPGGIFSARLEQQTSNGWDTDGLPAAMSADRQMTLFQSATHPAQWTLDATATSGYLAGSVNLSSTQYNGKARLDLTTLGTAGFGSWYLGSQNEIRFDGPIKANVANQLRLDAPKFSASSGAAKVNLTAAAIQLGNYQPSAGVPAAGAATGTATATFTARDIGISGVFSWNGFAATNFNSYGEVHFDSTANVVPSRVGGRNYSGQMTAAGKLDFAAARLSPSTWSDYRVELAADPASQITINRLDGATAGASLAAGGRLEFSANAIDQNGIVTAPLGEIVYTAPHSAGANGSVTLGSTSVTSVAADRTMLLGQTDQSGRLWQFVATYWNPSTRSEAAVTYAVDKAPEKAIRIDAAQANVKGGAVLNLSGGGEVRAWEFNPGPGGKSDVLDIATLSVPNVFAVLPSWSGKYAPQDGQAMSYYNATAQGGGKYGAVPNLRAGDQIRISAGSDLAAATYTLLPARYALLPGAYLVTVKPAQDSVVGAAKWQPDGSVLVSGSRLVANADGSATAYSQRPLTLEIAAPAVVARRASYQLSSASGFFYDTAGAQLPGDAGLLSVAGRKTLAFDPTIAAGYASLVASADGRTREGRGLAVDLAAEKLLVTDGGAAPDATWTVLNQGKLNALGASSVLLGGIRNSASGAGNVMTVETVNSEIAVVNSGASDAAHALSAREIMLTALDAIAVRDGSRISDVTGSGIAGSNIELQNGDGAFLRVAHGAQVDLTRSGSVQRSHGDLLVGSGAVVSGEALTFDATRQTQLDGNINVGRNANGNWSGGAVAIGAGRINVVGSGGSMPADGLTLDNASLARFAKADQLLLTSYTTLDMYGNAELGTKSLKQLTIAAAGIAGHGAADTVASLKAGTLRFANNNPGVSSFTTASLGSGTLQAEADTLVIGGNSTTGMRSAETTGFGIAGFDAVQLKAAGDLRFEGTGITSVTSGNSAATALTLDAGRVVAAAGSNQLLKNDGALRIQGGSGTPAAVAGIGGALDIRGASLAVAGLIDMPAGKLALQATTGNLEVENGARIRADGVAVAFVDTFAYAPAGDITLSALSGNVTIDSGAMVSVSATPGGDAGKLSLLATRGTVDAAAGTLFGRGDASDTSLAQGTLAVDALTVNLNRLATAAVDANGNHQFAGRWEVRQRAGDLALDAGTTIKSSQIALAADAGSIDIAGTLDASGKRGGDIGLFAKSATDAHGNTTGGTVTLEATGQLLANATEYLAVASGTRGRGGNVTVGVDGSGANIDLKQGGLIDVSVASQTGIDASGNPIILASAAPAGHVALRAPRTTRLADIVALASTNSGDTSTAYSVTGPAGLHSGSALVFTSPETNIGTTKLNVNGGGDSLVMTVGGGSVASSAIPANAAVTTISDGTGYWIAKIGSTSYLPTSAQAATPGSSSGSSANIYSITSGAATANTTGRVVYFSISRGNIATSLKGPVKLSTKGQPAVNLVKNDGSGFVNANDLVPGNYYAIYDGGKFVLVATGTPTSLTWYDSRTATSATATATQNTNYDVTSSGLAAYTPGTTVSFTASAASAGTTKLNVNGLGAVSLLRNGGQAVTTGDIAQGEVVTAVYDGSNFQVTSAFAAGSTVIPDHGTAVAIAPIGSTVKGTSSLSPVVVEAAKSYAVNGDATVDSSRLALWQADNFAFMSHASDIVATLSAGRSDSLALSVRPGIELRATGNITVATAIDFNGSTASVKNWRYGSAVTPGSLTLRAQGNLNVNSTISDGFDSVAISNGTYLGSDRDAKPLYASYRTNPDGSLFLGADGKPVLTSESWNYRLAAGADLNAANPLAVLPATVTAGNLQVSAPLIRSGTGSISLAAQGNVNLADGSSVYTVGMAEPVVVNKFGMDIDQIFAPSYFRPVGGGSNPDATTGISYQTGDTTINGARNFYPYGGGDVKVAAGGSIVEATAGSVTDWLVRYGTTYNDTEWYPRIASFRNGFATLGGGNVSLTAGVDIRNVTAAVPTSGRVPGIDGKARPDLARINGGGDLDVAAGGSLQGGRYYAESGTLRILAAQGVASSSVAGTPKSDGYAQIGLGDTLAHVVSGGDIGLYTISSPLAATPTYKDSNGNSLSLSFGKAPIGGSASDNFKISFETYTDATSVDIVSLNGAIDLANRGLSSIAGRSDGLAPSRVKVAALNPDYGSISGGIAQVPGSEGQLDLLAAKGIQLSGITQYDTPSSRLPGIGNPARVGDFRFLQTVASLAHGSMPWHSGDAEPSRLVALNGDISGPASNDVLAQFNEPVRIQASGDIKNGVSVVAQHLNASDVSRIEAGGDIRFLTGTNATTVFQVNGPGHLEAIAGGSIDLGSGRGIVSRGNLDNGYLPEGGADILAMAGTSKPDYDRFVRYLADKKIDVGSDTSEAGLRDRFYALLRDAGRSAQGSGGSYADGRALIAALFPNANPGNIDLFYSTIKTEQGGNVNLLAPGGGVTVGIATPNKTLLDLKKPSEQGLFTVRGGDIRAYVKNSFLVNQSRVFTLDGGDIMIWADHGSIDAGNGAKTVSATPPPVLVVRGGQVVLDASNSVAGSGIGVLASRDTTKPGNMDLFAPDGAIDAGDAGLRSTGNITLGARTILNASNIQAAGTIAGAPAPVAVAPVAAVPASPANTQASDAQTAAATAAGNRDARQGILTVEVLDTAAAETEPLEAEGSGDADEDEKKSKKRKGAAKSPS